MPLINKANAVSQLQTILSGVTVATEDTTRLLALLETAKNAGQYSANVENQLLTRISSVSTSNTVTEVALRAKATDLVHFDRQLSTANLTTLNAFSANVGTIVFVDSESVPYIRKNNNTWSIIDAVLSSQLKNAWSWGRNNFGQLGDGTTSSRSSPVSVVGGFTDWIHIGFGGGMGVNWHSAGIRANGTLWAWGRSDTGQVGDGTTTSRSSPVSVIGGFTDWTMVAIGQFHTVALRANGLLYAWGSNFNGRLGDNTTSNRSSPVSVVGGFTDWIAVSAGQDHNVALRANGTIWGWGPNSGGRLGDGTTTNKSSPVSVVGGFTDWTSASAGLDHSHGIRANGTLWGWGNSQYGQVGNNSTTLEITSPVSVVGGFTDWILVSAGSKSSLGLRANGTLWAWGRGEFGRNGDGTTSDRSSPVSVVGGYTDWVSASTSSYASIGLRTNGTLWAWGRNAYGRLGDGTTLDRSSPVSVVGGFTDWISVAAGSHSLALRGG